MIKPPQTYYEWAEILDLLKGKTDDRAVLKAIQDGTIEWQAGVAERFAKKLTDSINARMNAATDKFKKDLQHAYGMEGPIVQALIALRKEMNFLSEAINVPAIPEQDRAYYFKLVRNQADIMQASLEDSAKKDRTGKMSNIIRNHKVNAF